MPNPVKSAFKPITPPLPAKAPGKPDTTKAGYPAKTNPVAPNLIAVTLQLVDSLPKPEPIMIRSVQPGDSKNIAITLNTNHLIVAKSLHRADSLFIKFLCGLALAEWIGFWRRHADGRALGTALIELAQVEPEGFFGITLASKLTASELLRPLDTIPIFGPNPNNREIYQLFQLTVPLHDPSGIPNWRPGRGWKGGPPNE